MYPPHSRAQRCSQANVLQGLMYFEATFLFAMGQRWPRFRRHCGPIGLFVIVVALIASSFSTHVWHLIVTQGILYGIGGGILYAPVLMFLDEWFVKRKGLAFGVMMVSDISIPIPSSSLICLKWRKSNGSTRPRQECREWPSLLYSTGHWTDILIEPCYAYGPS